MNVQTAPPRDAEIRFLLDQALDDQKSNWDRGEGVRVEQILALAPALRDDAEAVLDLIYQEYVLRKESGEKPDPNEFTARFPELAGPIMLQLGVDAAIPTTFKLPDDRNPPTMPECAPTDQIGDHEILAILGRGGMGVVYQARDLKLGRVVAIKMMIEGRYADPEHRDRFRSEAQAAARLRHPNIIAIHAIGEHENRPYLSLEFAEGGSLAQRLAEKPMAPREAAELSEILARAVHAAHQAGVVHRDLKPSNVLLTSEGIPKVSDFGLAKLLDSDSGRTITGQPIGTPSYMAPEQAEGHSRHVGPAADVYALGAILYQALAGRPPFLGESALETLKLVTCTDVVPPRRLRPDVPQDLETICLKCLEKRPSQRYSTSQELADDLRRYQRGEPILARRIDVLQRSAKWARRHPWQSLSASIVVSAVVAIVGLTYRHNLQLRAEIGRTEAKAAEVRRGYQSARSAIQAMLARLNEPQFAGTPRLKELGGAQMEDALSFYNGILQQDDSNDPVVRNDTARAFGLVSTVQFSSGRTGQAERQVRQALDLIKRLRAEYPDNTEYLGLQVECFLRLGVYLEGLGRVDEAVAAEKKSVELAEILARATPDNPSHQELVATCHDSYATRLRQLRRFSDARDHYQVAIEIRERLDPAEMPDLVHRHAETLINDGVTLWNMNQFSQADARFHEVEKLILTVPAERRNNVIFGRLYLNWSGVLYHSRRFDEAIDRAEAGLRQVALYLKIEPNDAGAREVAFKLHGNRALALSELGRHGEAVAEWTRATELSAQPLPAEYRVELAVDLVYAGKLVSALEAAQQLTSAEGLSGTARYNLGCLYSLSAAAARSDLSIPPDQRTRVVVSRKSQALRWLKSAAEAGFFQDPDNREHAKKDPDLEILRDRPEFREIVEKTAPPTPAGSQPPTPSAGPPAANHAESTAAASKTP